MFKLKQNDTFSQPLLVTPDFAKEANRLVLKGLEEKSFFSSNEDLSNLISRKEGSVGIIEVDGVICQKGGFWSWLYGYCATEMIKKALVSFISNPEIEKIVMIWDSPGGTVPGVQELSDFIFANKETKPIISYVSSLCCSAGIWIASSATKIYASCETDNVGSIGVYVEHVDISKRLEELGYRITDISSAEFKTLTSPYKPLSRKGEKELQERVDLIHSIFARTIKRNRAFSDGELEKVANGKVFMSKEALDLGLIDGIKSLEEIINMSFKAESEKDDDKSMEDEDEKKDEKSEDDDKKEEDKTEDDDKKEDEKSEEDDDSKKEEKSEEDEDDEKALLAQVKSPALFQKILDLGIQKERTRVVSLFEKTPKGYEAMVMEAIHSGKSKAELSEDILSKISEDGFVLSDLLNEQPAATHTPSKSVPPKSEVEQAQEEIFKIIDSDKDSNVSDKVKEEVSSQLKQILGEKTLKEAQEEILSSL